MSNRNKPISACDAQTQAAVAVLSQHVNWRKWPLLWQVEFLFTTEFRTDFYEELDPGSMLVQLYEHCVAGRSVTERVHSRIFLVALAAKRTALLERPDMASALGILCTHYRYRLRELADWTPHRKNVHFQLESLVRHLFDQYGDVPPWVIGAWTSTRTASLGLNLAELTVHLGRGRSLRSFPGLPVPLTKRLEHEMRQAPAACTILEALRYAQLAGREALDWFGVVLDSRLGRNVVSADEVFWLSVVDFFRAAPMVDPRQFGPVCDWIHQKRSIGIGTEPPQPGFSLKGRTMDSVLAQADTWQRQLRRDSKSALPFTTSWEGLPVADFVDPDDNRVRITQLVNFGQLVQEGRALRHCVASYVKSCRSGRCGIFALTVEGLPTLTLEVNLNRMVVQIRGLQNRRIADKERIWVNRWLREARLVLSQYA
jgi:hypothetical protein